MESLKEREKRRAKMAPTERQREDMAGKIDRLVREVEQGRAGKRRPVLERIGSLQGRGSYVEPGAGFGGLPTLTDQDVAGALAMIRKDRNLMGAHKDIAPEILETYYGSTQEHRSVLRAAYLRANPLTGDNAAVRTPCRRMAASIAIQMLAGMTFSRGQQQEFAYICFTRLETMREEIVRAVHWLDGKASEAALQFRHVVDSAKIARFEKEQGNAGLRLAQWQERREKRLREAAEKAEAEQGASGDLTGTESRR